MTSNRPLAESNYSDSFVFALKYDIDNGKKFLLASSIPTSITFKIMCN